MLREAVRQTVTEVLQILLDADREAFLRQHGGRKNGYYPRKLDTAFCQLKLATPRDRTATYYPSLLQPYARRQVAVGELVLHLYPAGVSQRKPPALLTPFQLQRK
ncbi:transposase, partial [Thermus scotoductus]